jgi:hypothetical protein
MSTTTQRFIGTKTVLAEAMTRAAYNAFRGWTLPADENGADAGYLVEYLDGGKPNVPGRAGYVSWSPKEQFDNAYRARPLALGLAPHQQRVVDEKAELDERLEKLVAFTRTPIFAGLDSDERNRLDQQAATMAMYSDILGDRISAFAPAAAA